MPLARDFAEFIGARVSRFWTPLHMKLRAQEGDRADSRGSQRIPTFAEGLVSEEVSGSPGSYPEIQGTDTASIRCPDSSCPARSSAHHERQQTGKSESAVESPIAFIQGRSRS
jgi:hypothetical protein